MNIKIFSGWLGKNYVIIRLGLFGFHRWTNKPGTYQEIKLGLVFLKFQKKGN